MSGDREEEFRADLHRLVQRSAENGVDPEGVWPLPDGEDTEWVVEVTRAPEAR